MARTAIAIVTKKGPIGDAQSDIADSVMTDSDPTNDHEWTLQDGDELLVKNTHATLTRTVDVIAQTDVNGRTLTGGKSTKVVAAAGGLAFFGPFRDNGWGTAGKVQVDVDGSASDVQLVVLRKPAGF